MRRSSLRQFALVGLVVGCGEVQRVPDAAPVDDGAVVDGSDAALPVDGAVLGCGADRAACVGPACGPTVCLQPAHVPTAFGGYAAAPLTPVVVTSVARFDTATGAITGIRAANAAPGSYQVVSGIGFIRRAQGASAPLAVWVFSELTITAATTTSGSAAMMLASLSSLTISSTGSIDAGGKGIAPGPGGFLGGTFGTAGTGCGGGGAPTGTVDGTDGGGGGGGFGTSGSAGGSGAGGPGAGGSAAGCGDALETFLVGGSGGGGGDTGDGVSGPFGGGGGGALQLTAMGQLRLDGVINVGGGGGRTPEGNSRDGAGGGSGGALFLEAPVIAIGPSAGLFANGGGGGSASSGTGTPCAPGSRFAQDGRASLSPAGGSTCATGNGGAGAAGGTAAVAGASAIAAGGGGGGLGRIMLRTLATQTPAIASSNLSPAQSSPAFRIVKTLN